MMPARSPRFILLACLALFSWLAHPAAVRAEDTVTLKLTDHIRDGRRIGYWFQMQVADGDPAWMLVDTGSRGLMVMAGKLGSSYVVHTGKKAIQGFLDGTVFKGEIVLAQIRLGPVVSARPVPVLAVQEVTCREGMPDCPGRHLKETPLGGVLGIGIGKGGLENPLSYLPGNLGGGYILHGGGQGRPASLTFGLTPSNRAGFVFSPSPGNPAAGSYADVFYQQNSIPGCFALGRDADRFICGKVLFDSGSSWSFLHVPPGQESLARKAEDGARTFHLAIPGLPQYHSTIGDVAWTDRVKIVPDRESNSLLGAGFVSHVDLLYDLSRQAIGIRPNW